MTVYQSFSNPISASLAHRVPLIRMVRMIHPQLSLVQAKDLVENVNEAIGMNYNNNETIDLFDYMSILIFAYRLNIEGDIHWAVDRVTLRWIDKQRLAIYKMLLIEWINSRHGD